MKVGTDGSQVKSVRAVKDFQARVRRLALIGAGKLGEGLLSGMLGSQLVPAGRVEATVAHQPHADDLTEKYGIKTHTDNARAVSGADLVLVCLNPNS